MISTNINRDADHNKLNNFHWKDLLTGVTLERFGDKFVKPFTYALASITQDGYTFQDVALGLDLGGANNNAVANAAAVTLHQNRKPVCMQFL